MTRVFKAPVIGERQFIAGVLDNLAPLDPGIAAVEAVADHIYPVTIFGQTIGVLRASTIGGISTVTGSVDLTSEILEEGYIVDDVIGSFEGSESESIVIGDPPSITLTPYFQTINTTANSGYRLAIIASNAVGMPEEIFRYYEWPMIGGTLQAEFSGVCSWPDLEAYPAGEARVTDSPRVFRLNYMDIVVDSEDTAREVWETVQQAVENLVAAIRDGEILDESTPVTVT
jgi:hypothetical protein